MRIFGFVPLDDVDELLRQKIAQGHVLLLVLSDCNLAPDASAATPTNGARVPQRYTTRNGAGIIPRAPYSLPAIPYTLPSRRVLQHLFAHLLVVALLGP